MTHATGTCRDHSCVHPANERRRYSVTPPLIGWTLVNIDGSLCYDYCNIICAGLCIYYQAFFHTWPRSLTRKYQFDEIVVTCSTEGCHNDKFQCSQWQKFRQNDIITVSVSSGRCHCKKIIVPQWIIISPGDGLVLMRRQSTTWTNDDV